MMGNNAVHSIPPNARSWVEVGPESHFPIQNLPIGLAVRDAEHPNCVVFRIGDYALDLCPLAAEGLIPEEEFPLLHCLIDLDRQDIRRLRQLAFELLSTDNPRLRDDAELRERALVPVDELEMAVPVEIPQFVDFYAGIHHASNVGRMFRPDMPPLLPNYRHVPIGYNGRASSVVPSGHPIKRPKGQTKGPDDPLPVFGPTKELDFELELGFFVSHGNPLGEPITPEAAADHILGYVLVNDWSARDVQRWEYQPLGPFLAKSFATSISPWIVLADALEPFRIEGQEQEPAPLPHLKRSERSHFDLHLEVAIQTPKMTRPQVLTRSNARHLYWSCAQMLAHQTSNGTNLQAGDLYATGTISGPEEGTFGSLLELTWRGSHSIEMEETGEARTFLEDGDNVILTGYGQGEGFRVGFGELRSTVVA